MLGTRRFMLAAATRSGSAAPWPYQRVVRAMEKEGKGLLVGAEVFKQFNAFYQNQLQSTRERTPGGDVATAAATTASLKPLTAFCGSPDDVEPLTVLLLKVLCDLQRLEEMRFLFTQCLLELDYGAHRAPSVELFNVYLLAISTTDTFNQNEVENLVDVMQSKGVVPDIVTKLSMLILYLRLGQDACLSWLPAMMEEAKAIVSAGDAANYPLLPLRTQHAFQTMLRLHCAPTAVHDLFSLLQSLSPERLTPSLLLPYLLISVNDAATPPRTVVSIVKALEDHDVDGTGARDDVPLLSGEGTIMRLLSKCAQWKDAESAAYVHAYVTRHSAKVELSEEAHTAASLLYVEALVASSDDLSGVMKALQVMEREVPRDRCVPGDRPRLFLESRRMTLLTSDPVTNLVNAMCDRAPGGDLRLVAAELLEAKEGGEAVVSAISLDLLMAAAAHEGEASFAEVLLHDYTTAFHVRPTSHTFASLLLAHASSTLPSPALQLRGVARARKLLQGSELAEAGVSVDGVLLHACMEVALRAHDVDAALMVAERCATVGVSVPTRQGTRLLRETTRFVDVACTRRALAALRASHSVINRTVLSACVVELRRQNVVCDDLL